MRIQSMPTFFFIMVIFMSCNETGVDKGNSLDQPEPYPDSTTLVQIMDSWLADFREEGGVFNNVGSITLDIGDVYIGQYKTFHLSDDGTTLVGYNRPAHLLEFVDMEKQKIYNSIQLTREGPGSTRKVTGIYYHNKDSIFVMSDFHLLMINEQGDVKSDFKINRPDMERNDVEGFDFTSFVLVPGERKPIHFYPPQQALIIPMHSTKYNQWTIPQFYESPVCAKLLLKTRRVETIPLHYPDEYRKHSHALVNKSFFTYNKEKVIVGFNNSPTLFSYNLKDETSAVHNCSSKYYRKFTPFTGASGDEFATSDYTNERTVYAGLQYVKNKHQYYMVSGTKGKDFPGVRFNLTILNEELKTMCELTVPNFFPAIYMMSVSDAVAFRDFQNSTDTQAIYQVVDIDCE